MSQLRNLDPQDLRNLLDKIIVVGEQYPSEIIERFRTIILQHPVYFEKIKQEFKEQHSMFNEWMNNTFASQRKK